MSVGAAQPNDDRSSQKPQQTRPKRYSATSSIRTPVPRPSQLADALPRLLRLRGEVLRQKIVTARILAEGGIMFTIV
jgi:hypothetical protein